MLYKGLKRVAFNLIIRTNASVLPTLIYIVQRRFYKLPHFLAAEVAQVVGVYDTHDVLEFVHPRFRGERRLEPVM